jgi:Txe/YoeB family toxin of Txe-Axe toxin-antitoxin module
VSVQSPQQTAPVLHPSGIQDDNPLAAADDEVIEKEWVDRAKKIVEQTKSDPYKQEQEVSKLQADYLKKRYGKEVKVVSD